MVVVLAGAVGATVTVDYNNVRHTHSEAYHGQNLTAFWWGEVGDQFVVNAMRRSKVQIVRYPGGVPGNLWDWDTRGWLNMTPEELAPWAAGVGCELLIETNPYPSDIGDGTNDPSGAHWAAGVQHFKDLGMNVKLWEIGNEPEIESYSMTQYCNSFNQQAPAIKAAHPEVTVMGPAGTNTYYWMNQRSLETFLSSCNSNTDAISLHWYLDQGGVSGWNFMRDVAQTAWPSYWSWIRARTSKPVYITEWTCLGPGFGDIGQTYNRTIGIALADCDVMMTFARLGVAGHTNFTILQVDGNWGILCSNSDYRSAGSASPRYFVLPLVCTMGNIVLNSSTTSNEATDVSAYAHKRANGNPTILLINKTSSSRSETIQFNGFDPTGVDVDVYELRASSSSATSQDIYYNGVQNPNPSQSDLPAPSVETCSGTSFTRSLPAYSITVLDFQKFTDVVGEGRALRAAPDLVKARVVRMPSQAVVAIVSPSVTIGTVRLYDARGRTVLASRPSGRERSYTLECGGQAPGAYVLEVETNAGHVRKSVSLP
jgi:hypothetical protein